MYLSSYFNKIIGFWPEYRDLWFRTIISTDNLIDLLMDLWVFWTVFSSVKLCQQTPRQTEEQNQVE